MERSETAQDTAIASEAERIQIDQPGLENQIPLASVQFKVLDSENGQFPSLRYSRLPLVLP